MCAKLVQHGPPSGQGRLAALSFTSCQAVLLGIRRQAEQDEGGNDGHAQLGARRVVQDAAGARNGGKTAAESNELKGGPGDARQC